MITGEPVQGFSHGGLAHVECGCDFVLENSFSRKEIAIEDQFDKVLVNQIAACRFHQSLLLLSILLRGRNLRPRFSHFISSEEAPTARTRDDAAVRQETAPAYLKEDILLSV
jgi:hypothetical protein